MSGLLARLRAAWCEIVGHRMGDPHPDKIWESRPVPAVHGRRWHSRLETYFYYWYQDCQRCGRKFPTKPPLPEHPMCKCII